MRGRVIRRGHDAAAARICAALPVAAPLGRARACRLRRPPLAQARAAADRVGACSGLDATADPLACEREPLPIARNGRVAVTVAEDASRAIMSLRLSLRHRCARHVPWTVSWTCHNRRVAMP